LFKLVLALCFISLALRRLVPCTEVVWDMCRLQPWPQQYCGKKVACLTEAELGCICAVLEQRLDHPYESKLPQEVEERRSFRSVVVEQDHCMPHKEYSILPLFDSGDYGLHGNPSQCAPLGPKQEWIKQVCLRCSRVDQNKRASCHPVPLTNHGDGVCRSVT
jgi:hypothetical protein